MTITQFNKLKDSNEKSILILSASWCNPCKVLAKTVNALQDKAPNIGDKITKIDIEEYPELAEHLSVQSVPTVYYLGDGKPVVKKGIQTEAELCNWLI